MVVCLRDDGHASQISGHGGVSTDSRELSERGMKSLSNSAPSQLPTPAPSTDVRLLGELHAIQSTLVRLTEVLSRISQTLERATNRH